MSADSYDVACSLIDGCLVCGDVAVPVVVVESGAPDAVCEDAHGQRGRIGIELVSPVEVGERLLVHAGVAISRLEDA
ncbi:MAG: HypC/HybG/HupF family hydrogenase formation chaperone [Actinomycetota bacterium]|nr:HypC/HybG/HupF family hydrogenase formation chaperone [Actinomycetota bacterium]